MESINNFQEGNYIQYQTDIINKGLTTMVVDRILLIDDKHITTEKGLTITKELSKSQFQPIPIVPEWLEENGFKKYCKEKILSIWENTLYSYKENRPITITIIEHNENKSFFLGITNMPLYAHSLQNLLFNITGHKLELPIKL